MKNCNYPDCFNCEHSDCVMEKKDIIAIQKRRNYHKDVENSRQKQRDYRDKIKSELPECDKC